VHPGAGGARDGGELGDRLHGADLVARVRDRHQGRVGADRLGEGVRFDATLGIHRQHVDLEAVHASQVVAALAHRLVFERGDHEVPAAGISQRDPFDA
jgi:hypothetical protein